VKLRNAEIAKNGRSYSWDTKKAADEVVKTLKAAAADEKPKAEPKPKRKPRAKAKADA